MKNLKEVYKSILTEEVKNKQSFIDSVKKEINKNSVDEIDNEILDEIYSSLNKETSVDIEIIESDSTKIKKINVETIDLINYVFLILKEDLIDNFKFSFKKVLEQMNNDKKHAFKYFKYTAQNDDEEYDETGYSDIRMAASDISKINYKHLFEQSNQSEGVIETILNTNNRNEFTVKLCGYLYSKLKNEADIDERTHARSNTFNKIIKLLTTTHKNSLSVDFGFLFEEIFRGITESILKKPRRTKKTEKVEIGFENVDLKHNTKKIAVVLCLILNKKFNKADSEIFKRLDNNDRAQDDDFKSDFKKHIFTQEIIKNLKNKVENIVDYYARLIGVSKVNLFLEDYEKDDIFCKLEGMDNEIIRDIGNYKTNSPFDFIVRSKNFKEDENNFIGLFDLKLTSEDTKTKPVAKKITGSNKDNSACNYILDMLKIGRFFNDSFNIKFLALVEITYALEWVSGSFVKVDVKEVKTTLGDPIISVLKSLNKEDFKLAMSAAQIKKNLDKVSNCNEKINNKYYNLPFEDNDIKSLESTLNILEVVETIKNIYESNPNIKAFVEKYMSEDSTGNNVRNISIFCYKDTARIAYDIRNLRTRDFLRKYKINEKLYKETGITNIKRRISRDETNIIELLEEFYKYCHGDDYKFKKVDRKNNIKRAFTSCLLSVFLNRKTEYNKDNALNVIKKDLNINVDDKQYSPNSELMIQVFSKIKKEDTLKIITSQLSQNLSENGTMSESIILRKKTLSEVFELLFI